MQYDNSGFSGEIDDSQSMVPAQLFYVHVKNMCSAICAQQSVRVTLVTSPDTLWYLQ